MSAIPKPTKNAKNQTSKTEEPTTETKTEAKTMKQHIPFGEYNPEMYKMLDPKEETVPNSTIKFFRAPTVYDYEGDASMPREFRFEGPELTSKYGLSENPAPNDPKKMTYSIGVMLSRSNPVEAALIKFLIDFRKQNYDLIHPIRGKVGVPKLTDETFKSILSYRKDPDTKLEMLDSDPTWYINLFRRGKPGYEVSSLFTDFNGKAIDWSLLKSATMKFIPLISVKGMTSTAGKVSIKMEMVSAVVTGIEPAGMQSTQNETIDRLKNANPQLASQVEAQLANMAKMRLAQNQSASTTAGATKVEEKSADAPSNSGITKRTALPASQEAKEEDLS